MTSEPAWQTATPHSRRFVGSGRAAEDAGRGGRAGARRDRGGRRSTGRSGGRARSRRSWSRSRCRSASTTPTTTPTACAAPTRTGADRCGSSRAVSRRRPRCATRGDLAFAVAAIVGGVLSLVVNPWLLLVGVAGVGRRGHLHRRAEAVRLHRSGRGDGAGRSSGSSRPSAARTCSTDSSRRGVVGRARGRAAGVRRSCSRTTCATSTPTAVAGKRTLAVRIGAPRARLLYVGCMVGALVAVVGVRRAASVGVAGAGARRRSRSRRSGSVRTRYRSAVARRRADRDGAVPARAGRAARGRAVDRLARRRAAGRERRR